MNFEKKELEILNKVLKNYLKEMEEICGYMNGSPDLSEEKKLLSKIQTQIKTENHL